MGNGKCFDALDTVVAVGPETGLETAMLAVVNVAIGLMASMSVHQHAVRNRSANKTRGKRVGTSGRRELERRHARAL